MIKTYHFLRQRLQPVFTRQAWQTFGRYVGMGTRGSVKSISDINSLSQFINTRASHVAQSGLYGYLRTRAGTRFPQLFENPDLLVSINIAKWHVWLACLSDLCIFFGYLLKNAGHHEDSEIQDILNTVLDQILEETGIPHDAGPHFEDGRDKVLQRIHTCNWAQKRDTDAIFSESPDALTYWAPIAHELKQRDEEIVINSIRFRWLEIRREARQQLNPELLARERSSLTEG